MQVVITGMPYSDLEIAEQFANEIRAVEDMIVVAAADEALLLTPVADHLRTLLDGLMDQIEPHLLEAQVWCARKGQ